MFGIMSCLRQIECDQRALGKCRAGRGPVLRQTDHQLVVDQGLNLGLFGKPEPRDPLTGHKIMFRLEGRQFPPDQDCLVTGRIAQCLQLHADVIFGAAKYLVRGSERLGALQPLDDERIARGRQVARLPLARHVQRIVILPDGPLFAVRKHESARPEACRWNIEFAYGHGILAAVRQTEQAMSLARLDAVDAAHEPVGFLRRR